MDYPEKIAPRGVKCRVCGAGVSEEVYRCREHMFGTGEVFEYAQCKSCGCLQILEIPADLSGYYPQSYYSYRRVPRATSRARSWFVDQRDKLLFSQRLVGVCARCCFARHALAPIARLQLPLEARILDVGSGAGDLLFRLRRLGFFNLTGIDPFLPRDETVEGVRFLRRHATELPVGENFECVLMYHSLEHLANCRSPLVTLRNLLSEDGFLIVRTPLVDSFAWRRYGVNWVQLDAPRHLHLHSRTSFRLLAESCGFAISRYYRDSTAFQFVGSELYRRNFPLSQLAALGAAWRIKVVLFGFLARYLNLIGQGDQGVFFLRRAR